MESREVGEVAEEEPGVMTGNYASSMDAIVQCCPPEAEVAGEVVAAEVVPEGEVAGVGHRSP